MGLSIDVEAVIAFAFELDEKFDDDEIEEAIAWVDEELNVDAVGQVNGDRMGLNLVAHILTMLARARAGGAGAGTTGPVQSVTIGPVTKAYSVAMTGVTSTAGERALGQTSYGVEYQRLVKLFAPRMAVI